MEKCRIRDKQETEDQLIHVGQSFFALPLPSPVSKLSLFLCIAGPLPWKLQLMFFLQFNLKTTCQPKRSAIQIFI
jgi:hypothetical protein